MKVLIARMNHETNGYSPVATPLKRFGWNGPDWGEDARRANQGTSTAMGAFLRYADKWGAQVRTPISAMALPSGPVERGAYERMADSILRDARESDAIFLDLHGAMVTEDCEDADGELLEELRRENQKTPIVVALDLHGNVSARMVKSADIIVGFKTYPHIDMYETGELASRIFEETIAKGKAVAMCWKQLPLLISPLKTLTTVPSAMRSIVEYAKQLEQEEEIYGVTFFTGFGLANIKEPLASVVVVADNKERAGHAAERLAEEAWRKREGFVFRSMVLKEAIAKAKRICGKREGIPMKGFGKSDGPIILLDYGDNCTAGGSCDTMDVLQESLEQGLDSILVGPICDPEVVEEGYMEREDRRRRWKIGNKRSLNSIERRKKPLEIDGYIARKGRGEFIITGPTYTGMKCDMGRSIVIKSESMDVVVTERTQEPWDLGVFGCMGINPCEYKYIMLKSKGYYRPVFMPICAGVVECDSGGVTTEDWSVFKMENIRRPVFPLEKDTKIEW